ncbi:MULTISPECIES: hypothetical protein [unclassified Polaribacter]|uniref:hypothetical protein n=1 Tax=unclassified Polaribacter TaxID=196858 RepID=UPI00140A7396|nr:MULTISPECIES: hypothetical protein [unclassified Polaribacter]
MAGEGFIAHMIASLKANKRNRLSTFDKIKGYKKIKKRELYFDKKATPDELEKIRKRIIAENNTLFKRNILIFILLITAILIGLNYVK